MVPIKVKPFFPISLIDGFLKDTQMFGPNLFSSLRIMLVEMIFLSLLNIALSSAVVLLRFDLTKRRSDR